MSVINPKGIRKPSLGELQGLPYKQHPRYRGMALHWFMGEGGGTTVRDISGFSRNGVMTGMVPGTDWVHDQFGGYCLDFDVTDDRVVSDYTGVLDTYTIAAWIAPNSDGEGDRGTILTKTSATNAFHVRYAAVNEIRFYAKWTGTDTEVQTSGAPFVPDGSWHHVAVTYQVIAGAAAIIYVDGLSRALTTTAGPSTGSPNFGTEAYSIGSRSGGGESYDGKIGDIRMYNRILNPNEIWSLYTDPFLEFRRPLFAWQQAAAAGRTTKNTHSFPLGHNRGMEIMMP